MASYHGRVDIVKVMMARGMAVMSFGQREGMQKDSKFPGMP